MSGARMVLTDSGGIQEETTVLKVPCLTLRDTTERPVTVSHGTNRVIGTDPARIVHEGRRALRVPPARHSSPPLWDGHSAKRIVNALLKARDPREHAGSAAAAHAHGIAARRAAKAAPLDEATA